MKFIKPKFKAEILFHNKNQKKVIAETLKQGILIAFDRSTGKSHFSITNLPPIEIIAMLTTIKLQVERQLEKIIFEFEIDLNKKEETPKYIG